MHFFRILAVVGLVCPGTIACKSSDDAPPDDQPRAGTSGQSSAGNMNGGNAGTAMAGGAAGASAGKGGSGGGGTSGGNAGTAATSGGSGGAVGGGDGTSGGDGGAGNGAGGSTGGSSAGGAGNSAGGSDGGSSAASGGSGGTDNADPCASALFCDDFESYTTGQTPNGLWTAKTNSGTVTVDETRHASGTKAVKFATTGSGSSKTAFLHIQDASVFPVPSNTFYGRMLFYLDAAPSASVHWTFIQGGGLIEGQSYHALYRYGGQQPVGGGNQLMANYETPDSYSGTGPSSDCWHHSNGKTVPVAAWSCAEWKFDGVNDEMRFWLDGVAVDDLTVSGTGQGCVNQPDDYPWTAPNFATLDLGWESYQTDSDRTLYIDDVVISTTQIGCPE